MDENFYTLLGITETASIADIKKAYRTMAMRYHPDHNPDDAEAAKQFRNIRNVYEILRNPITRADYDALLGRSSATPRYEQPKANQWEGMQNWERYAEENRPSLRQHFAAFITPIQNLSRGADSPWEVVYVIIFLIVMAYELLRFLFT